MNAVAWFLCRRPRYRDSLIQVRTPQSRVCMTTMVHGPDELIACRHDQHNTCSEFPTNFRHVILTFGY